MNPMWILKRSDNLKNSVFYLTIDNLTNRILTLTITKHGLTVYFDIFLDFNPLSCEATICFQCFLIDENHFAIYTVESIFTLCFVLFG